MCGIVGVVAERSAVPILMEGLRRLEYRGYDSAGIAVLDHGQLGRLRTVGKVKVLQDALDLEPMHGSIGIAHTRWATHGVPTTANAHPHISRGAVAIVHNGIIENHETLRAELKNLGYSFTSETDTEVIAHRIHHHLATSPDLFAAVRKTVTELQGAYALAVLSEADPECIVMARQGCPAVIGLGLDENFVASDVAALLPVTRRFMFLEEGDVAEVRRKSVRILDAAGRPRDTRGAGKRSAGRCRGARSVPALHAQGNSRAAARNCADAGGAHRGRQTIGRRLRSGGRRNIQACQSGAHRRLRHQLSRGPRRPAISSSRSAEFRPASRSPANTDIAIR